MTSPSPSIMTAVTVLDTLVRTGMRHVLVSPGSRSAPLTYAIGALVDAGVIEAHVRIDERVAAFTALGIARASGAPVGVVTTSGTAVGECLPAVMEAYHSGAPLAVLSADRPAHLQGTGANQTTDQSALLGHHVRAFAALENYTAADDDPQNIVFHRALAALTGRDPESWGQPSGQPVGPVHLNIAFDTPLTPHEADAQILQRWAQSLQEVAAATAPRHPRHLDLTAEDWLRSDDLPAKSHRTVVVAGDGAGAVAQRFAQKLGLPLLAEPSSNARFSPVAVPAYRQILAGELGQQIERAVIFGHTTLSRPVAALLANKGVDHAIYEPNPAPWHQPGTLDYPGLESLHQLAEFAGGGDSKTDQGQPWLDAWAQAGAELQETLRQKVADYRTSGMYNAENDPRVPGFSLALRAWEACLEDDAVLLLGSSNLIRDLDLVAPAAARSPQVFANRGLAGIDGTIATASGISLALNTKVRVLCGDLTFLHDLGALNIGPLERTPDVEILVLDDRGGGIFATLEHGQLGRTQQFGATVQRFFTTPHSANLEELASAWGKNGISLEVVHP
ncbi:2-succinyl-5-enolpyruvyl-6-hydroxy-3-cyclohexene-1-carboxylic-acid synthase [Rothia sp. (in: high G+C Gram-positive bacteria)]|uniref:2-succinyl-5-enolpyruvyl-6-hydroxy-3- cyclohexene-1-carboxylic-acid synthase n=1 Tax=Rothia sp. (in: high G+C Gram-positive bacteria) TaxID=1885016 RepID=UPI0026BA9756